MGKCGQPGTPAANLGHPVCVAADSRTLLTPRCQQRPRILVWKSNPKRRKESSIMAATATIPAPTPTLSPERQRQRDSRVVWFEIPAADFDRAIRFYEAVFATTLARAQFGPEPIAVFPYEAPAIGGCLIQAGSLQPGRGPLPYLNADPSLEAVLGRIESAGGRIVLPRTELPAGMGCFARFEDSEGNLVGIHAMR